jgi:hypothetical protein
MNAIRIKRHLDSDTVRIPELKPFLGKDVEIIIREQPPVDRAGALRELFEAAANPPVDLDALAKLREDSRI